jgi:carboxyl-terminal processing protease
MVPDSLIREFKTRNGRKVYDGGGVNPDVSLPLQEFAPVTRAIAGENVLFDFATDYRLKNTEIPAAKAFAVNDNIFEAFVKYIGAKEIKYETESEELLGKLKEAAEKEKYFESVQQEYNALKDKMLRDKKADIQKAKTEISELLSDEIVSRYYYQRGRIENSFAKDEELKKAVEILKSKTFYDDILAGRYVEEVKKKGK